MGQQGQIRGVSRRGFLAAAAVTAAVVPAVAACSTDDDGQPTGAQPGPSTKKVLEPNRPGPYDLVIRRGRVVDPETGLDGVRDIGIKNGEIASISEQPLDAPKSIDADGQVVAPGFIDLHAHGQQLPAAWVQAFDGVTTALELESGLLPISRYYELVAEEGRPINYGASAAWTYARIAEKEGLEPDGTIEWFQAAFAKPGWQNSLATPAEIDAIIARVEQGLKEGGLGIGINAGYAPGNNRKEYWALAKLAKRYEVPTYTHVRYLSVIEPQSTFEALGELVAIATSTGAHMHICHLNSTSARDGHDCVEFVKSAQAAGAPVTVEAYPFGAGSSTVGAEQFRGDDWVQRWGVPDASWMELNGRPLTQAEIDQLQKEAPGTTIVIHFLRPDQSQGDGDILDASVLYPGGSIASDGMPWIDTTGRVVQGDVWPLPEGAFAHPRSAGCFSKFISQYVRERKVIPLPDALAKTSLFPARVLESSVPQMRRKGRLQVGADADVIVFDLNTIKDNATFTQPAQLSTGMRHVVVNGTPIIADGNRIAEARPGKPIRRDAK